MGLYEVHVLVVLLSIGYGAYAQVAEARSMKTGEHFALKVVEKEPLAVRGMLPQLARELGVQRGVRHRNALEAIDLAEDATHAYLLLDLCVGGSVWQATHQFPNSIVPEPLAARWLCDATAGCAHLHDLGLVHRDVKLENLLLDANENVRICDFGWCAFEADEPTGMCGTPQLAAPEVSNGNPQTSKVDSWALGACLVQMLKGRPLDGPQDAWLPSSSSAPSKELGGGFLKQDPRIRLSAKMALEKPFLKATARVPVEAEQMAVVGGGLTRDRSSGGLPVVRRASAPPPRYGHRPSQPLPAPAHVSSSAHRGSQQASPLRRFVSQPPARDPNALSAAPVLGGAAATQARLSQLNNNTSKTSTKPPESPRPLTQRHLPNALGGRGSSPSGPSYRAPLAVSASDEANPPSTLGGRGFSPSQRRLLNVPGDGKSASPSRRLATVKTPDDGGLLAPAASVPAIGLGKSSLRKSPGVSMETLASGARSAGRGLPSASLRQAISPLVRRQQYAGLTQPAAESTKGSSKAAFDAALEHAVGVLEKQQQRMRKSPEIEQASARASPEIPIRQPPEAASEQQPTLLPEDVCRASGESSCDTHIATAHAAMDLAPYRAAVKEKASLARVCAEKAAQAREQAEEHTLEIGIAAREVARLTQNAVMAIEASRDILASSQADVAIEPKLADDALRSCGELSRRLAERSRARCSLAEVDIAGF